MYYELSEGNECMKAAIITVAGISSRFNEGIPETKKELKAVYHEGNPKETLLYHLLMKCSSYDKIILVGGYKFDDLKEYCQSTGEEYQDKISLVYNDHFDDLGSGYSLYLGLKESFKFDPDEVLFAEGDLDIDNESFERVNRSNKSVLTYTYEPIYANKSVVLYKNEHDQYCYAFNSNHGLLSVESPFSCILNSGQIWRFSEIEKLRNANEMFLQESKGDTNLKIIQNYLDQNVDVEVMPLSRWTNCNTRDDYRKIVSYWRDEK